MKMQRKSIHWLVSGYTSIILGVGEEDGGGYGRDKGKRWRRHFFREEDHQKVISLTTYGKMPVFLRFTQIWGGQTGWKQNRGKIPHDPCSTPTVDYNRLAKNCYKCRARFSNIPKILKNAKNTNLKTHPIH